MQTNEAGHYHGLSMPCVQAAQKLKTLLDLLYPEIDYALSRGTGFVSFDFVKQDLVIWVYGDEHNRRFWAEGSWGNEDYAWGTETGLAQALAVFFWR